MSSIEKELIDLISQRAAKGLKEYGATLERDDYTLEQWLDEAIPEQIDNLLYLLAFKHRYLKLLRSLEQTVKQNNTLINEHGIECPLPLPKWPDWCVYVTVDECGAIFGSVVQPEPMLGYPGWRHSREYLGTTGQFTNQWKQCIWKR
jgi:hypothetical protein